MRLHSDILTRLDISTALVASIGDNPAGGQYYADVIDPHGSRTRDHAFEIALVGNGARHKRPRAWGQGSYGKGSQEHAPRAATYDDWGYFIAQIFDADPAAVFGPYKGEDDFHAQTKYRFVLESDATFTVVASGTYNAETDSLVLAAFTGDPR